MEENNHPPLSSKEPHPKNAELPPIPEKRYFTIGEVSVLCALKSHVLRYWEQEFRQLKPSKRRGNRRYYRFEDVILIRKIRYLLYEKGFTIGGARLQLSGDQARYGAAAQFEHFVKETVDELETLLVELES